MELIALRHGQSAANAAFAAAADPDSTRAPGGATGIPGAGEITTRWADVRDVDVPLSPLGRRQSARIGEWFAVVPVDRRPELVVVSGFRRARQTWRVAREAAVAGGVFLPEPIVDARVGDRRMGEFELLTDREIRSRFPREAARRARDEVNFRPPGGESFPDLADRVEPVLAQLRDRHPQARVLLVVHDAVVLALRHLIEGVPWQRLLAAEPVANGSLTRWADVGTALRLVEVNRTEHLSQ